MFGSLKEILASIGHEVAPELVSKLSINAFAKATTPRPRPYSLWSDQKGRICDYVSWPSLTDRNFSGRHLRAAPIDYTNELPKNAQYDAKTRKHGDVTSLFQRKDMIPCPRSSLLFPFFAQWFTDSNVPFRFA